MAGKKSSEPQIVVRPIGGLGGLDGIHVALIVLVVMLIALLLTISYSKPQVIIRNSTSSALNCTYAYNGSCSTPIHNYSSAAMRVKQILASYEYVNNSLFVLAYYSDVKNMSLQYLPQSREWLAVVPVHNPSNGNLTYASFALYDPNLSLVRSYVQSAQPSKVLGNYVVSKGVVAVAGKFACSQKVPIQQFWFMDPYAPGSISSLGNLTSLELKYGSKLNVSIKILNGPATTQVLDRFGSNATALGSYVYCAAKQQNFSRFASSLESIYSNAYISPSLLSQIASSSHLDIGSMQSCISGTSQAFSDQALLAKFYNITQTDVVLTDCMYISQPQTAISAICYANSTLC
ncbi:MAG: hypothetical protein KGH61_04295 [Candidatus Micrarchaeota archaeon]|nr:hypothetical protein [Candidatus Micrarchaeota archaeon]MDE1848140.1 hypothetical protein [Candidatus Micrarchaeota archaeon]MDE1864795.1 hypothetical protein [Candidatus Micrarchaeota archaeon]